MALIAASHPNRPQRRLCLRGDRGDLCQRQQAGAAGSPRGQARPAAGPAHQPPGPVPGNHSNCHHPVRFSGQRLCRRPLLGPAGGPSAARRGPHPGKDLRHPFRHSHHPAALLFHLSLRGTGAQAAGHEKIRVPGHGAVRPDLRHFGHLRPGGHGAHRLHQRRPPSAGGGPQRRRGRGQRGRDQNDGGPGQ